MPFHALLPPPADFPFCTIDPNAARVNVPDDRFNWLCSLYKPKSAVSAFLDVVDIAGLVRGAAQGEGLGNAFLSHIAAGGWQLPRASVQGSRLGACVLWGAGGNGGKEGYLRPALSTSVCRAG